MKQIGQSTKKLSIFQNEHNDNTPSNSDKDADSIKQRT